MCLQCVTDAEIIFENIIPGYTLMKARADSDEWRSGEYGLVKINDPDFVWSGKPVVAPLLHLSDDELDTIPEDSPKWGEGEILVDMIESVRYLHFHPLTCWEFVQACIEDGYDPNDIPNTLLWFFDHVGRKLEAVTNEQTNEDATT